MPHGITHPSYRSIHAVAPQAATRRLLRTGIAAGPLWIGAAGRAGADPRRLRSHPAPVSVLSNGDLGWIQIASFVLCGLLFIAGARSLRTALTSDRAGRWVPRLMTLLGVGKIASGAFMADPLDRFPEGTRSARPE